MLFPASFKLALMCCSCLHHLLPWVASCSLVLHHAWLCIMLCSCVVCLLCCVLLLDSSRFVAIVRMRSYTCGSSSWLHLLHGLVLLPSGISGKMTATLYLTTIIAMLVASFYRYAALPITCLSSLLYCHEPLTFDNFPMQTIVWLCYRFAQPSYSVASCRWSWRLLHGGQDYVGISQYLLYYLMHLYTG